MNTVSSETTTQSRNLSFKASRAGRHPNAGTGAIAVGRNLAEDLAKLEPQTLQRNFRGAGNRFGVLLAIVTAVLLVAATLACNFLSVPQEITRWVTRVSCVAVPFSLLLALKQALSSSKIKFVQYVLRIADPGAHLRQAEQLVFNCDLLEAEKMLEGELKNAAAKQRSYISTCSALALVRAHMGKSDAAAQMIANAVKLAEHNYAASPSDSRARVLCTALAYAGEIAELAGPSKESLHLNRKVVEVMVAMKKPRANELVNALVNLGHTYNALNRCGEALPMLERALAFSSVAELTSVQTAYMYAGLSAAARGSGNADASDDYLKRCLAIDLTARSKDKARTCLAIARMVTRTNTGKAVELFGAALASYQLWKPANSPEHAKLLHEYAMFMNSVSSDGRAVTLNAECVRMTRTLQEISLLHKLAEQKLDQKVVEQVAEKPSRFPTVCALLVAWQGFLLWEEGLRVASYNRWCLVIFAIVVLAVKLKHHLSPPSREELGEGAITALLAVVPFSRSILPELSAMPKQQLMVVAIVAACLLAGARLVLVSDGQVPSGLCAKEYFCLGRKLQHDEQLTLSAAAYDKVIAMEPASGEAAVARRIRKHQFSKVLPPAAAIELNSKALRCEQDGNKAEAERLWRECTVHYSQFELPFVHLATLALSNQNVDEADKLLSDVLSKNPENAEALLAMVQVKEAQKDTKAAHKYLSAYFKIAADIDLSTAGMGQ